MTFKFGLAVIVTFTLSALITIDLMRPKPTHHENGELIRNRDSEYHSSKCVYRYTGELRYLCLMQPRGQYNLF